MGCTLRILDRSDGTAASPCEPLEYRFSHDRVLLGRGRGVDVWLPDLGVSLRHATIRREGNVHRIIDEGSTNGTWLGDKRLPIQRAVLLEDGVLVRIGPFVLEYRRDFLVCQSTSTEQTRTLARHMAQEIAAGDLELLPTLFRAEHGFPLPQAGDFLIGRGSHCDLVIDEPGLSREHVVLRIAHGRVTAEDLASKNRLWINGRAVDGRVLRDGDELGIGEVRLRFADPLDRHLQTIAAAEIDTRYGSESGPGEGAGVPRTKDSLEGKQDTNQRDENTQQAHRVSGPGGRSAGVLGLEYLVYGLAFVVFLASVIGLLWVFGVWPTDGLTQAW